MLRFFTVLTATAVLAGPAAASPIFSVLGAPSTYTPGDMLMLQIMIEDVTDLAQFDLELQLSSTSGTAGVDFGFTPQLLPPTDPNYVFANNMFPLPDFVQTPSDNGTDAFLLVHDTFDADGSFAPLESDGVSVPAGTSKLLADATIFTTANAGDLELTFGANTALFGPATLFPAGPPALAISLDNAVFDGSGMISAVPEPSTWVLLCCGFIGACLLRRRSSDSAASA